MKRISVLLLLVVLATGSVLAQNKVLSLDGNLDYVEVADHESLNISEHITMEAWVKWKTLDGQIISKRPSYQLFLHNQKIEGEIFTDGKWHQQRNIEGGTRIVTDRWYHISSTYDGENIITYVNGKFDRSLLHSGKIDIVSFPLCFGIPSDEKDEHDLFGEIDEVRIWNIARTEAEIKANMNSNLTGKENGLVGYWNFDDGTAQDLTANGNDGEFKGDAKVVDSDLALGVSIPDPNLRAALEKALGKNEGDAITEDDLAGLEKLVVDGGFRENPKLTEEEKIQDITGLEYATNLNEISLSPLSLKK